ncbi:MAG TPA: serine protease [Thermoanaerobaculia bacterium]|jgi:endonuclease G
MLIREELLQESDRRARAAGIAQRSAPARVEVAAAANEMAMAVPLPATASIRAARAPAARVIRTAAAEARRANTAFAGANPSPKELERFINGDDLVDEFFLERALVAARPVCRITVSNAAGRELGWATGFMISPSLLLTNWHVFTSADEAVHSIAEFEYTRDIRGNPVPSIRFGLQPQRFFFNDRTLDYALVAVNPRSTDGSTELSTFGYHRLVDDPHKIFEGEWVTIIQHPGGDRRQFAIRDNLVIEKKAGNSFMWYQSDTAQGSSGAPAFNDSFQVVALHHSGKARQDENGMYVLRNGQKVEKLDGIDDSLIDWFANERRTSPADASCASPIRAPITAAKV